MAKASPLYKDGIFVPIDSYSKVYVYKYKGTIPAKEAKKSDFSFIPTCVPTDDILRPATKIMVQVFVDVICVPEVALTQVAKEAEKDLLENMSKFLAKRPKYGSQQFIADFSKEYSHPVENMAPTQCIDPTDPKELSKLENIMTQYSRQAEEYGLKVFKNQSSGTSSNYYSEYELSKPDGVVCPAKFFGTKIGDKILVIETGDEEDNLCKSFQTVLLAEEMKTSSQTSGDPIGQLWAGIPKIYADAFVQGVLAGILLAKVTIFGIHLIPKTNYCKIYKFNLTMNSPARVFEGKDTLHIHEALNRVTIEM